MLRSSIVALKKGWTHNPGRTRRGGKNLAWRPKISEGKLNEFVRLNLVHPRRHPNSWHQRQFNLLGYSMWPKEVGFYNSGDNFELTPEASWRLFKKCCDDIFWTKLHNESTVIHLLPLVEKDPSFHMKRVMTVFRHHLKRFGADHYIYHAVMQAHAFARDVPQCERMLNEMIQIGLAPNDQTYVNLMLGTKLSGKPDVEIEAVFKRAVQAGALKAVMRLDTEFQMWLDQLNRLGSFTSPQGFLSVNEEGATPMPMDMFAIWGWHKSESKFRSRKEMIDEQVRSRVQSGKELIGTVYSKTLRQPWAKYGGMLPADFRGPPAPMRPTSFADAPPPGNDTCMPAW